MNIYVICAFRQRPDLLARSLASIAEQDADFVALVGDDASTDDVGPVLDLYADDPRFVITRRSERLGVLGNWASLVRAEKMAPDDILVTLDGDDRFAHPSVLSRIAEVYERLNVDVTYGNYLPDPPDPNCPPAVPIPEWVLRAGCIRLLCAHDVIPWNHPISARRILFDHLTGDDLTMPDGSPVRYGYDVALMCAFVEMAGTRVEFCPEVLYTYTSDRPESVFRAHAEATHAENAWVIHRPQQHEPIEWEPS